MRVADAARAGFSIGYAQATALHPVGLSESARITLDACIRCAEEDPRLAETIVEATLELGALEGVWAAIFDRRLALIKDGTEAILNVWRAAKPDLAAMCRELQPRGLTETIAPVDPTVLAAATAALSGITTDAELEAVVAGWVRNGTAEGRVTALALAADEQGSIGFDFNLAFDDAYAALADLEGINSKAVAALIAARDGAANDLGRVLSPLVRSGAPYADLLTAAEDLFTTGHAATYYTDIALSAGMTQGALDLYTSEGVAQVNWVTAGDGRVCLQCESFEEANPYPINDAELPPAHGRCRCCITADDTNLSPAVWSRYVGDTTAVDEG